MAHIDLSGCTVWLTRPASRAADWRDTLAGAGARVLVEPLLAIGPPDDRESAAAGLDRAEHADYVIATSANAVAGLARLRPLWAPRGRLLAVGSATAGALAEQTGARVAAPENTSTEGLLAMPELAGITDCTVAILAGHGGREKLADSLAARGARVDKLALYRRRPAEIAQRRLDELIDTADALVITSSQAWQNLIDRLTPSQRIRLGRLGLAAASRRVIQQSRGDVDWLAAPVVIQPMSAAGAVFALDRACPARRQ